MKKERHSFFIVTILFFTLFMLSILKFDIIETILLPIIKPKSFFLSRASLFEIAIQHIFIVIVSSSLSIVMALIVTIFCRLPFMSDFEDFLLGLATFGQTIPTVAVLALLIPFLGYGFRPALLALFIYGFLPVLRNTIEGINSIPKEIIESAQAMGMNNFQIITKVELPLSLPAILAGIRISLILNISVATIGAAVGLSGFGTLIVNGIRSDDLLMILKGALPVSLLALTVESLFMNLEKKFKLPLTSG